MTQQSDAQALLPGILAALAYALVFGLLELMIASARPDWLGGLAPQWTAWAAGVGLYAATLALVGVPVAWLLARSGRRDAGISLGLAAVASLLWCLLATGQPSEVFALSLAAVVSVALLVQLAISLRWASLAQLYLLVILACAAGAITLRQVAARFFAFHTTATTAQTLATLHAAAIFALGLLLIRQKPGRPRRWAVAILVLAAAPSLLFASAELAGAWKQKAPGASLLLITSDALRADSMEIYGGPALTPELARLADAGALFRNSYALAPWTVPSLAGLFSSKFPPGLTAAADQETRFAEQHSYQYLSPYFLSADGRTSVEALQSRGFTTAAICSNVAMRSQQWLLNGFERTVFVDTLRRSNWPYEQLPVLSAAAGRYFPFLIENRLDSTALVSHYGIQFLRQHRNERFFLWIHYMDPHSPYAPPRAFLPERKGPWERFPPTDKPSVKDFVVSRSNPAHLRRLYRGEVEYVDQAIGRVLGELAHLGLDTQTYVAFTSDHGEEFWEHDRWGHGHSLYEELMRVPLILAGPGISSGEIEQVFSAIDLMPTLFGLLGVRPVEGWMGVDRRSMIAARGDDDTVGEPVFMQSTDAFMWKPEAQQAVRHGDFKLIIGLESGSKELYNLAKDPHERRNLYPIRRDVGNRLEALIVAWRRRFPYEFAAYEGGPQAHRPKHQVDPETRARMEALGYLAPED